ncbi:hypothetical protein VDS41_21670 [Xanthomonas campestris pv. campestris]|nr:hypothetical protein [Xanthomonas campestris pv. campestris]
MTELSVQQHVLFLSGYLDAVARLVTTDAVLCNLSATFSKPGDSLGHAHGDNMIDNWSIEFGSFVDSFLGISQRSGIGFYLVDYICWLSEFTAGARCFKSVGDAPGQSVIYYVEWPDGSGVVIVADRHHRPAPNNSFKPNPLRGSA